MCSTNHASRHEDVRGRGGIITQIFTSTLDTCHLSDLFPGEQPTIPIEWEAGGASEPVWTLWGKHICSYRESKSGRLARSLFAIPTELPRII
jgi:hypothetical protein